jgi:AAA+ superfamily predicted ATPase
MITAYILLIFLCSYANCAIIESDENTTLVKKHPIVIIHKGIDISQNGTSPVPAIQKHTSQFTSQEISLFEEAFAIAPIKLKTLINSICKGESYTAHYKNILLTGPSGSGKTTLAQTIAYKLQRKCTVVHAPSLLGHYRDQAVENIRELFQEISQDPELPILIIDEINAFTDGYASEQSDTKHTAMQLWTLLDKHKNDQNFLLIGTTNITKKMPHQLQSRFKGQTFFIGFPVLEARKRSIKFLIQKNNAQMDTDCTDQYLLDLAQKIEGFSQRDIEALVYTALLLFSIKNPMSPKIISKEFLEQAYTDLKQENERFWDFSEPISDEERRHKENLALTIQHFQESQEMQIRLSEWNLLFQASLGSQKNSLGRAANCINKLGSYIFPTRKPRTKIREMQKTNYWGLSSVETELYRPRL